MRRQNVNRCAYLDLGAKLNVHELGTGFHQRYLVQLNWPSTYSNICFYTVHHQYEHLFLWYRTTNRQPHLCHDGAADIEKVLKVEPIVYSKAGDCAVWYGEVRGVRDHYGKHEYLMKKCDVMCIISIIW